jgi:hypothetical protein
MLSLLHEAVLPKIIDRSGSNLGAAVRFYSIAGP